MTATMTSRRESEQLLTGGLDGRDGYALVARALPSTAPFFAIRSRSAWLAHFTTVVYRLAVVQLSCVNWKGRPRHGS